MPGSEEVLRDLFIVFLVARLAGEVVTRIRLPAVVAELLVGVAIGPHALGWVDESEVLLAISEVGVVFLLFSVGLENRLSDLRRVGGTATSVAVSGVVVPFVAGFALLRLANHSANESLFMGAAMVATSVGITASVLSELRMTRAPESQTILGAAIIDDVLGLLVLALVVGSTRRGGIAARDVVVLLIEAAVFLTLTAAIGTRAARALGPQLERLRLENGPFAVAIVVCLGLAALADWIGLAAIVGAFLAGIVFAETREQYDLERTIDPVVKFLTPFFFVATGMRVELGLLSDAGTVTLVALVFVIAVIAKLVPCALSARRFGRRGALIVGTGMVPRGEVGIIVASLGLSSGAIRADIYGVVVAMSILTSIAPPVILRALFRDRSAEPTAKYA